MASVLPVTLFTPAVAAGCAQVDSLVPANLGPHDWQATPADLARLSQADVLVINGLGLESHLDKLVDASGNAGLRQIDSSRGVATIANPAAAPRRRAKTTTMTMPASTAPSIRTSGSIPTVRPSRWRRSVRG